jgi:hypothetical protein
LVGRKGNSKGSLPQSTMATITEAVNLALLNLAHFFYKTVSAQSKKIITEFASVIRH